MPQYKTLIIGAGNIGALLDTPEDANIITHAHACYSIPEFSEFAFVDPNKNNRDLAEKIWGKCTYSKIDLAIEEFVPDVIAVSSPLSTRKQVLASLPKSLKFIFWEKPLGECLEDSRSVLSFSQENNIPAAVNYTRLYSSNIRDLRDAIAQKRYGKLIKGVFTYGKGFKNNGSHLVSLVDFLFGQIQSFNIQSTSVDYSQADFNVDVSLQVKDHGSIYLLSLNENCYSNIESYLYFEKARVTLRQFGHLMQVSVTREDLIYPGYRDLDESSSFEKTDLANTISHAYKNILEFLNGSKGIVSTLDAAFRVEMLVDKIRMEARK